MYNEKEKTISCRIRSLKKIEMNISDDETNKKQKKKV